MAEKNQKSQAERAASAAKARKNNSKKPTKSSSEAKKQPTVSTPMVRDIPPRLISSVVFIGLFILFLVAFFVPEGFLVELINKLVYGLLGKAGFIVSIPVLLYLFIIHAFSGKRPVSARTICLIVFTVICGSLIQPIPTPDWYPKSSGVIAELWNGGIDGSSGGVICGGLAMLLEWPLGRYLPYVVLIISGIFTLLGGMQITIPSIVRAIKNRPRPDWEEEEKEERQEPAALVVNHIASKRIQHLEKRRQIALDASREKSEDVVPLKPVNKEKAEEIMRQIGSDVEEPVAASAGTASDVPDTEIIPVANKVVPEPPVPEKMPPLTPETELADAPILEKPEPKAKKVKVTAKETEKAAADVAAEIKQAELSEKPTYQFPPIDLLQNSGVAASDGSNEMRENSRRLNETLASFKIEAHIINVTRGPSVTRYEVELEKGVRLSKITTAADDIALSLGASGVRIAAIPGKISVVGIEVPNRAVTSVSLREVIDSAEFRKARSKSAFAVGKDIGGNCIVGNIAKLPHMLIAGTTGSGKSVCMNSIIISLLYKASPDEVKLIMVDPKMVELGSYNGIPHLLIPVVTDPKKAAGSLQWAVVEMMRRYKSMSDAGVRDLESYNSIMESQGTPDSKLPQIVVIIDELADLMLVAAKEVEESICRIAQMGRAAGIHLVIATQRPSADVITGLMKANIPSRIAFSVASAMESRIILDTQGAEKLVGKGDMLFAPIGDGKPKRVQGCFVSEPEVEAVTNFVKANYRSAYDQDVMEEIEKKSQQTGNKVSASDPEPSGDELAGDEMLPAAVDVILETGQASVSMLQRRLKLGYARAARIVDEMEEMGIVGPFVGSKPRAILITKEQWTAMQSGQSTQMGFDDMQEESSDA